MNKFIWGFLFLIVILLPACSVKTTINNQYKLESFSHKIYSKAAPRASILVSQPEAAAGYQTEQMLYIKKPFGLSPFAKSAWVSPPANLLTPLIIQSLHDSHYFYAVLSPDSPDKADYRLDTQLLALQQNFLDKPSRVELVVKLVLAHVADNRIIASKIIHTQVECPQESPYGGVVAANLATLRFTQAATEFVIQNIKHGEIAKK